MLRYIIIGGIDTRKRYRIRSDSIPAKPPNSIPQGTGAPAGVHPDFLRKVNVTKVNHTQRTPHESSDIGKDTEEFANLTSIMEELMLFIQANVSFYCVIYSRSKQCTVSWDFICQTSMTN